MSQGQETEALISTYLQRELTQAGVLAADVSEWEVTDTYASAHNGVTHVHIRQQYQGIPVYHGVANVTIKDGVVRHLASRLEANLATRVQATQPTLTPAQAVAAAATALGLPAPENLQVVTRSDDQQLLLSAGGISQVEIPVRLMYQPGPEGELFLAWDLSIYPLDGQHWWSVRIDALTGELRSQTDWVLHCAFPDHAPEPHAHAPALVATPATTASSSAVGGGEYRVFARLIESPNHGPRTLEVDPADSLASPYGWHDDNGAAGAEYTWTRGNNVYATEDRNNDNIPGYSPDGGSTLSFDFPYTPSLGPVAIEDAAITNLFYYNNIMHDVWYHYGFDEPSGNFQANNYGRGGQGGDYVNADAQDGSGTNNANFGTPPDGNNPRMQMYIWTGGGGNSSTVQVNSPITIAGGYGAAEATFGPSITAPITGDVVIGVDGTNPNPEDGCDPLTNGAAISGKIAMIYRGNCPFVDKVQAAQDAGAIAAIVVNNTAGGATAMGGFSSTITIPSVMITDADGATIRGPLDGGGVVNVTLLGGGGSTDRDSDFDNGIIAHEYTHGISNRLTGGGSNTGCLSNSEQMGEGWSDYYGLMTTFDPNVTARGIGTYAIAEPVSGIGIRNERYSPDFSVNDYTYGDVANTAQVSQPHGIGFVWCTMLWDLTLKLVDEYGYDPDYINGTGGNNLAMQLVTDGLKLQPCSPGFVDGRDAILLADQLLTGGVNECLIWEVFARRGLGASASQGSANSRSDQTEAFDLPSVCQIPVQQPIAGFLFQNNGACGNEVRFEDNSSEVPQSWFWDFGDGSTDTIADPVHVYLASGTYTITQVVTNTLGSDTTIQTVTISLPNGPNVLDTEICVGDSALLSVSFPSNTNVYEWYDSTGNLLVTAPTLQTPGLSADVAYQVREIQVQPVLAAGSPTTNFGAGGYHNSGFTGTLNFQAFDEFTILSVLVDAGSAGARTINLWDGIDGNGSIVDQVTVNMNPGQQRVTLNLVVPGPGTYSVGGTSVDLFRNSNGASYPYEVPGLLRIFSSSATTGASSYYYYLYDWEVQQPACPSDLADVAVNVFGADFSSLQDSATATFDFTDLSQGAGTWAWDFGDGNISTLQNPTHTYDSAGTYVVTLLINGACSYVDTVEAFLTAEETGISPLASNLSLSLSPNPAREEVMLSLSRPVREALRLSLYDAQGRLVQGTTLPAGQTQHRLDLQALSAGVYSLRVQSRQGQETLRLMVK
jgi:PKD repeat protein